MVDIHILHVDADAGERERAADHYPDSATVTVTGGDRALGLVDGGNFDAVVCVHRPPDLDAVDFLERIRNRRPDLPVVVVPAPGEGSAALAARAFRAGATDYRPLAEVDAVVDITGCDGSVTDIGSAAGRSGERPKQLRPFEPLIEHSTDVIVVLGVDGTFEYVNPSVERITGHRPSELVGENALEYVHPDDRADALTAFEAGLEDPETVVHAEFRFRNADGDWQYVETRGTNRLDDPAVEGFVVNARDVNERVEREEELRTARAITEGILHALPDLVYAFDPEGGPIREDLTLADIPGYTDEEINEKDPLEFIPEEDEALIAEAIETVLEEGTVETRESAIVTADGREIPHEFSGAPLADEDGNILGVVGVARDISERKAREQELERYERLMETVGDAVYAVDPDGRYQLANGRVTEMTGYTREEIVGSEAGVFLDDEVIAAFDDAIRDLLSQGGDGVRRMEHPLHAKDGSTITCETRVTLLPRAEDGSFRGTVGSTRGITERKERERELERQNERLEGFASVVSHDLRNPLNVIQGHLELARRTGDEEHFAAMERGVERMDDLISDLLSLARQGKTIGERTEVDPAEVATDAWESIDAGSARLEVAAAGHVHADEGRLSELFENLYRNAIEHGGSDVTVRVGGLPDRDGFFIEDDGPGIPEEESENALEHGYTTAGDGTGLGLTIVDSIVEAHGWSLDITESTEGGARFEITATDDGQQAVLDHATGSP